VVIVQVAAWLSRNFTTRPMLVDAVVCSMIGSGGDEGCKVGDVGASKGEPDPSDGWVVDELVHATAVRKTSARMTDQSWVR
jgi:hypothetical protein